MAHRTIVLERAAAIAGGAWRETGARLRSAVAVALAAVLVAACGGSDDGEPPDAGPDAPRVASITVSPPDPQVGVGLSQALSAQARDQYGAVMADVDFTWQTTDAAVAVVDQGVVTGVAAGSATITAASDGVTSNAAVLSVVAVAKGVVVIDKPSVFLTASGQGARLAAQVLDEQGAPVPGTVRWTSSAPGQVSVDANGQLQALVAIGSATIVTAEAGGLRSAPTLVVVADAAAGRAARQRRAGGRRSARRSCGPRPARVGAGSRLRGDAARRRRAAAGNACCSAAESAPVAGTVVATRARMPPGIVATLALAAAAAAVQCLRHPPRHRPVAPSACEDAPDRAAGRGRRRRRLERRQAAAGVWRIRLGAAASMRFDPFRAWEVRCQPSSRSWSASRSRYRSRTTFTLALEDRPGYSKHALEGSAEIVGSAGLKLKAGFKASGTLRRAGPGEAAGVRLVQRHRHAGGALRHRRRARGRDPAGAGRARRRGPDRPRPRRSAGSAAARAPTCRGLDAVALTDRPEDEVEDARPANDDAGQGLGALLRRRRPRRVDLPRRGQRRRSSRRGSGRSSRSTSPSRRTRRRRDDYASSYDLKLDGVIEPGAALAGGDQEGDRRRRDDGDVPVQLRAATSSGVAEGNARASARPASRPTRRSTSRVDLDADDRRSSTGSSATT